MARRTGVLAGLVVGMWLAALSSAAAQQTTLGTFRDWTAFVDGSGSKRICYIGSMPKKTEGTYTKRGETHVLVTHRPADKVTGEISVTLGYTYKDGKDAEADIAGKTYKLFTRGENAWAYDSAADKVLVNAMKAAGEMLVRGISSRGTVTTDTYSLAGFSAAYAAIGKACGLD